MKIKNIKYYATLLFMTLNISLTGCKATSEKENFQASNIINEDVSENIKAEIGINKIGKAGEQLVLTATKEINRIEGIREGLGELVELQSITIYQNKNKDKYQVGLTTKNKVSYVALVEDDLETLTDYFKYITYTCCNRISLNSCADINILESISNKEKITTIEIINSPAEDLSILSEFPNIEELIIQNCPNIQDIETLSTLSNLNSLSLVGTKVSDLKAISELEKLSSLDLRCNEITEEGVAALENSPNLTKIDLFYNKIYDPDALNFLEEKGLVTDYSKHLIAATSTSNLLVTTEENEGKTEFYRLVVVKLDSKDGYFISIEDENENVCSYALLDSLKIGKFLTHQYDQIVIRFCEDCDILKNIQQADKVKEVIFQSCDFEQLEYLEKCENAGIVSILGNPSLSDISNLSEMKNLKYVKVENTNVSDITALSNMPSLEYIDVLINQIEEVPNFLNVPNLKTIDLRFNYVTDSKQIEDLGSIIFDTDDTIKSQFSKEGKQKSLTAK